MIVREYLAGVAPKAIANRLNGDGIAGPFGLRDAGANIHGIVLEDDMKREYQECDGNQRGEMTVPVTEFKRLDTAGEADP